MNGPHGITFEDVMKLCNVHANLFKNRIIDGSTPDSEHPGHPIQIFKQENIALHSTLLRIRRIIENYTLPENIDLQDKLISGLKNQLSLLEQFKLHYTKKENILFPIMEKYGHTAPPKVMWGVDDNIRELFDQVITIVNEIPFNPKRVSQSFESFAKEFEEMIFKEESILLMILLETFSQDDWLKVQEENKLYGFAIIQPEVEWIPNRISFTKDDTNSELTLNDNVQVITTKQGKFTISFEPNETTISSNEPISFGNGFLTLKEANLILDHLPMEITFVNKDDIFQYYNNHVPLELMIFKRNPSQIGRHVNLCHPPQLVERVEKIFTLLRTKQKDKVTMWFKKGEQFVHVTYKGVFDEQGEFYGVLEYVQNIQPFFELGSDMNREI